MATTEIVGLTQKEVDLRARRASEALRQFIAEDYSLIVDLMVSDQLDQLAQSVRIAPTGEVDPTDGTPVFLAVGDAESPEATVGKLTRSPVTIRYRKVSVPLENGPQLPALSRAPPTLPAPNWQPDGADSHANTVQEET